MRFRSCDAPRRRVPTRALLAAGLGLAAAACGSPVLHPLRVLDRQSFGFNALFLAGDRVACSLLDADGYRLAIFSAQGGKPLRQLRLGPPQHFLHDLALAPDGSRVASAFRTVTRSGDHTFAAGAVGIHHLGRSERVARVDTPLPVRSVAFIDQETVVFGTDPELDSGDPPRARPATARICLVGREGKIQRCVSAHDDAITALASIAPPRSGAVLASASWDGTVRLWRRDLTEVARLQLGAPVNAIALAAAGKRWQLVAATSRVRPHRDRERLAAERRGEHRRGPPTDGVQRWDLDSRRRISIARDHTSYPTAVAVDPTGRVVATGGWDFRVVVRRAPDQVARLEGFSQIVTGVTLGPRGRRLLVSAWTEHRSGAPSCLLVSIGGPQQD